jgi:membrane protease YdiL (CAAX protease family)
MNEHTEELPDAQPESLPASHLAPLVHQIFMGPSGLRAGWRLLIYVAGCYIVSLATSFIVGPYLGEISSGAFPRPRTFLLLECQRVLVVILPVVVMARFEKRPFGAYGLPFAPTFAHLFLTGAGWGFAAITVLLLIMRSANLFYFGPLALHGTRLIKFAVFWAVLFLVVAFAEEFMSRGYSQFTLAQGIGFWPAAFLLSFGFGALHFPQEYALGDKWGAWAGSLAAACIGLFWCLTLKRTGNLWFAIGMHMSWDWSETFFYSVPDSGLLAPGHLMNSSFHGSPWLTGGSVGPEGSVLVFLIVAAMWIIFDRLYPNSSRLSNADPARSITV